jgi:hypothetical protein
MTPQSVLKVILRSYSEIFLFPSIMTTLVISPRLWLVLFSSPTVSVCHFGDCGKTCGSDSLLSTAAHHGLMRVIMTFDLLSDTTTNRDMTCVRRSSYCSTMEELDISSAWLTDWKEYQVFPLQRLCVCVCVLRGFLGGKDQMFAFSLLVSFPRLAVVSSE